VILKANTFIDGTWYGPDYGNADLPPEVEAKLGRGDVDAMTMQLRTKLVAAFAGYVNAELIPRFVSLSSDDQADVLEVSDDLQLVVDILSVDRPPEVPATEPAPVADDAPETTSQTEPLTASVEYPDELDLGDTEPAPIEVPEGSVDELLAWVHGGDSGTTPTDGWYDRARAALEVEKAGESPRKTLVEPLEREIAAADRVF
jgi:hypothetical protein